MVISDVMEFLAGKKEENQKRNKNIRKSQGWYQYNNFRGSCKRPGVPNASVNFRTR